MVQSLLGQMTYNDPVVYDWAHIKAPTFVYRRARGRPRVRGADEVHLRDDSERQGASPSLPRLGHVPHIEAPDQFYPPLVAFLKEGL